MILKGLELLKVNSVILSEVRLIANSFTFPFRTGKNTANNFIVVGDGTSKFFFSFLSLFFLVISGLEDFFCTAALASV